MTRDSRLWRDFDKAFVGLLGKSSHLRRMSWLIPLWDASWEEVLTCGDWFPCGMIPERNFSLMEIILIGSCAGAHIGAIEFVSLLETMWILNAFLWCTSLLEVFLMKWGDWFGTHEMRKISLPWGRLSFYWEFLVRKFNSQKGVDVFERISSWRKFFSWLLMMVTFMSE